MSHVGYQPTITVDGKKYNIVPLPESPSKIL
jgi:hypothetical protein